MHCPEESSVDSCLFHFKDITHSKAKMPFLPRHLQPKLMNVTHLDAPELELALGLFAERGLL